MQGQSCPCFFMHKIKLPFTTSHAFIVGINAYKNGVSPLKTAVKDAEDIAELLGSAHGYTVHSVFDATKAELEALFEKMKSTVKANDRVLFYFAGHGIALDSEKDPEGFLVPADADPKNKESLVSMKSLHETLHALACKHGLLVLDCCFAGAFKWSTGFRDVVFNLADMLYEERFYRFVQHPAWQVITSAAHDQKALDIIEEEALGKREESEADSNSPFARALKQAINLEGLADVVRGKRSDGVITASELYIYLRDIVEAESKKQGKRQSPSIFNLRKHDKGEFVFLHPGHPLNLPKAPETNPYKGLNPYRQEDARFFFGRDEAVEEMAARLAEHPMLIVSAPSGQGKSSSVRAGLFPFLRKKGYQQFHAIRPGAQPQASWEELPEIDPTIPQIVLIDQYEEFFTDAGYEAGHEFFEMRLLELLDQAKEEGSNLKIVITIRSDFEWQFKSSVFGKAFWDDLRVRDFLYRLSPMSWEELKQMMEKTVFLATYDFESDAMVDRILEEINNAPGALPLLSFTLQQLYELRDKNQRLMTLKTYIEELGGINGALSTYADRICRELPSDAHRDVMRKLMLRMVRLNDSSYSRRRIYLKYPLANEKFLNELAYPDHLGKTVKEVIQTLEKQQLLIQGKDKNGPYVEPMHDSLINFWPTCLAWIQDFGRENLELQRQLWKAVIEHHAWEEPLINYGSDLPDHKPAPPLWDNNPKLQQVQLAVTDPKNEWLCQKGWQEKSISSVSYLLWDREPSQPQLEEMAAWDWFFKEKDPAKRYQKIQDQMDHWLNKEELDFVKKSFEQQRSELDKAIAQRNEAIKAKEAAEEMTRKIARQTVSFKQKYQERARRDLHRIKAGQKPNLHLMLVGIDKYPHPIPPLKGCVSDVRALEAAFKSQEGKLYKKVICHVLIDEQATRKGIFGAIDAVEAQMDVSDYFIVFFVGHGTLVKEDKKGPGSEAKPMEKEGAFLAYPEEAKIAEGRDDIAGSDLCRRLMQFQNQVVFILDVAYGAEMLTNLATANRSDNIQALTHSVFALSGTSPGQMAMEVYLAGGPTGAFSHAIKRCFQSHDADLDGNGMVYLDELFQFTSSLVAEKVQNQNVYVIAPPSITNIPLLQLGDTFSLPKKELALNGHIEDDHVIEGIMKTMVPENIKKHLQEKSYDEILLKYR